MNGFASVLKSSHLRRLKAMYITPPPLCAVIAAFITTAIIVGICMMVG